MFSPSHTFPEKPLLAAQFSASLGEWHVFFATLPKCGIHQMVIHATSHRKSLPRPDEQQRQCRKRCETGNLVKSRENGKTNRVLNRNGTGKIRLIL